MKLNYKKTFLIGFGFLATSIAWAVYNAYVPIILESYIQSTFWIGAIMTIDNIFGVVFQPLFGHLSDNSRSKMGKRMPFIIIGIPVCAVLLAVILCHDAPVCYAGSDRVQFCYVYMARPCRCAYA
jgi:Na+/melibiose symporter-like transporter